jgi:predicted nucleotidyltransferase
MLSVRSIMDQIENRAYNLKDITEQLISRFSTVNSIALFGSRRFKTSSIRSDIDILISSSEHIRPAEVRSFVTRVCPALDVFILEEGRAVSCVNESFLQARSNRDLLERLQAVEFWNYKSGLLDVDIPWSHEVSLSVNYAMTALPNRVFIDGSTEKFFELVENAGFATRPFIGSDGLEVASFLGTVTKRMLMRKSDLGQRGQAIDGWTVNLQSEYDCQNLFWTVMKPWLPTLSREEIEIKYGGQSKYSDFSLFGSKIIIEMKYIDSNKKKADIVKTLRGLADFYILHPNVDVAFFAVFVTEDVEIDAPKWEADFSYLNKFPKVVVRVYGIPNS